MRNQGLVIIIANQRWEMNVATLHQPLMRARMHLLPTLGMDNYQQNKRATELTAHSPQIPRLQCRPLLHPIQDRLPILSLNTAEVERLGRLAQE